MLSEKKLANIMKALGKDTVAELDSLGHAELKETIVSAEQSMTKAKAEMEANPEFQLAKEAKGIFEAGLREVNKRQRAKIGYSIHLLEARGEA